MPKQMKIKQSELNWQKKSQRNWTEKERKPKWNRMTMELTIDN